MTATNKFKNHNLFESRVHVPVNKYLLDKHEESSGWGDTVPLQHKIIPQIDDRVLEVFEKANDPNDPLELMDLWIGRIEHESSSTTDLTKRAEFWKQSRRKRNYSAEEVKNGNHTIGFVKELFNFYFRDDLYGNLFHEDNRILSSGSIQESIWGLPESLKECVKFALNKDWYGYSDSRGRSRTLTALSQLENAKFGQERYDAENIVVTMGATHSISGLADFLAMQFPTTGRSALCGIPNYPPLVQSIANRFKTKLVPLECSDGVTSLAPIAQLITDDTPLVMIQTVANPTGSIVDELELSNLIKSASKSTYFILDECHEWLGPTVTFCDERAASNVIRVNSLSKTYSAPGIKTGWFVASEHLIQKYYEYASTSFGGPPSLFYTLLEVAACFERWRIQKTKNLEPAHLSEFENSYGLSLEGLNNAFNGYCIERDYREKDLKYLLALSVKTLNHKSTKVIPPSYSINLAVELLNDNDSYKSFREILKQTGVSVYPGILNFFFANSIIRISPTRDLAELEISLNRLRHFFDHNSLHLTNA